MVQHNRALRTQLRAWSRQCPERSPADIAGAVGLPAEHVRELLADLRAPGSPASPLAERQPPTDR